MYKRAVKGMLIIIISQIFLLIYEAAVTVYSAFASLYQDRLVESMGDKAAIIFNLITVIIVSILPIVYVVMYIIGLIIASRDEKKFLPPVFVLIFSQVVTSAIILLGGSSMSDITAIISDVAMMIITVTVAEAILKISEEIEDKGMIKHTERAEKIIIVAYVATMLLNNLSLIFNSTTSSYVVGIVLLICSSVLNIVVYILFLNTVVKARKMLREFKPEISPEGEPEDGLPMSG